MAFCAKCGGALVEGGGFCGTCGVPADTAAQATAGNAQAVAMSSPIAYSGLAQRKSKLPGARMFNRLIPVSTVVIALLVGPACNSGSTSKGLIEKTTEKESTKGGKNVAPAESNPDPGIDLNCVYDHLQNPPESFHYLYTKDATDNVHQEADVTPQTIDGFRTRRVNFTLRYVPDEHVVPFARLSPAARSDVGEYVRTLAATSPFFAAELAKAEQRR